MEEIGDPVLLATWRTGDHEAFAVLVARYHSLVHSACARQAAPGDLDDCVQAVFLVLARRPAAAERAPSLAAWLVLVTRFVCRHSLRSASRRQRAESGAAKAAMVASAPVPSEALHLLDDCLLHLPEKQRTAVILHYLAGKSTEEVAAALGTSRDNAYQLLSRGLAGLRSLLARRGMAMGSVALVSLLASEARAAAPVSATPFMITTLTTPSVNVTALATGALTAMTFLSLTTLSITAGVLLTATAATMLLTVPPALSPTPSAVAPSTLTVSTTTTDTAPTGPTLTLQRPSHAADDPTLRFQQALLQTINIDWRDAAGTDFVEFMRRISGCTIAVHPRCRFEEKTFTCVENKIALHDLLQQFADDTGTHLMIHDQTVEFLPKEKDMPLTATF